MTSLRAQGGLVSLVRVGMQSNIYNGMGWAWTVVFFVSFVVFVQGICLFLITPSMQVLVVLLHPNGSVT